MEVRLKLSDGRRVRGECIGVYAPKIFLYLVPLAFPNSKNRSNFRVERFKRRLIKTLCHEAVHYFIKVWNIEVKSDYGEEELANAFERAVKI